MDFLREVIHEQVKFEQSTEKVEEHPDHWMEGFLGAEAAIANILRQARLLGMYT